jgi:GT2 family glycosyltransferase
MIAVVVITHNRVHLLRECVENVLSRASEQTTEIVLWDNGSTDATPDYLGSLRDPRISVIRHPTNVGMNGYARGFARTTAPYMIELDDDIVDAPQDWDAMLLDAYLKLPDVGFLASDLVADPNDTAAKERFWVRPDAYRETTTNGVRVLLGPTGGGCAITDRALSDRVGGFRERPNETFWLEDAEYIAKIEKLGFRAAILADLRVHHKGGAFYSETSAPKLEYWNTYLRRIESKRRVKRAIFRLPFVSALNRRFCWFEPPS